MDDDRPTVAERQRGREALLVLLAVLLGGAALEGATRVLHVGPTLGKILFAALPILVAAAAATRLHHEH